MPTAPLKCVLYGLLHRRPRRTDLETLLACRCACVPQVEGGAAELAKCRRLPSLDLDLDPAGAAAAASAPGVPSRAPGGGGGTPVDGDDTRPALDTGARLATPARVVDEAAQVGELSVHAAAAASLLVCGISAGMHVLHVREAVW